MAPALAEKLITGRVTDLESGDGLPQGTVQILGTYEGTVTNADGAYQVALKTVPSVLRFSYIGYQSVEVVVETGRDSVLNVALQPVSIFLDEWVVTAEDMGPSMMRKVIAQKQTWWGDLASFQVRAYSRFTYYSETDLVAVAESLSDAFWDREKGWREVVKDKRETKNLGGDFALPAVAAVNLYDDEIEIGGHTLVGVTHPEALDHYDFKLIGRRFLDRRVIYDIEVTPRNRLKSAFTGQVSVIDSVYAMKEARLSPNRAFLFPPPVSALGMTLFQQFSNTGGIFWLPIAYQSEVDLEIGMVGLQFPPIKAHRVSKLSDYQINIARADSLYEKGRASITVDSASVATDSLMVRAGVVVPLLESESIAYEQIDSTMTLQKAFKPTGFLARFIDMDEEEKKGGEEGEGRNPRNVPGLPLKWMPLAWFDRVDGAHLGSKLRAGSDHSRASAEISTAYNTALEKWSMSGQGAVRWGQGKNGFLAGSAFRQTEMRYPSALYDRLKVSGRALFGDDDYFDHFWNEGARARGGYHFRSPDVRLSGGVNVERHRSVDKATDWNILGRGRKQRANPRIDEGQLGSVVFQAIASGDRIGPAPFFGQRKLTVEVEHSQTGWGSDFSFTQLKMVLDWRLETFFKRRLMPNVLDIRVVGSAFTGHLPRQRYVILDTGLGSLSTFGAFRSRLDLPYEGEKHLGVFWEHNFRTVPFEWIGWQWAVRRNLGILIHGAHGRTWISSAALAGLADSPTYQNSFHHEAGASINGLFDLLRVNVTRRLDTPGTCVSMEMARIF